MKAEKLFRIRKIIPIALSAAGIWLALRFSRECSRGILNGMMFCVEALVPSLFIFMAAAACAVKSGAAVTLTRRLGSLSRAVFGLPSPALAAFLLSIIGGYPLGARCASMMLEQGQLTRNQAEKVVYTAVCAGPGFLVSFVGGALLGSPDAGILLLSAEIISVLLTGVIVGKTIDCERDEPLSDYTKKPSEIIVSSVNDATSACLKMCGMVIICSAAIEVIGTISPDKTMTDISAAIIEITTGCGMMSGRYPLAFIAFFIGFGGLSVHLQIFAFLGNISVRKGLFFLFRIIQGIICSAATYILLMMIPLEVSVFNSTEAELTIGKSATLAGSAALIICSLCFLTAVGRFKRMSLLSGSEK